MNINQFLVKYLTVSNQEAISFIRDKRIIINNEQARQKQLILDADQILLDGSEIKSPQRFKYIAYYKPRGVECTLNPAIANNLQSAFPPAIDLFPVGRLDKDSEGLLLLTDDGKLYKKIAPSECEKEKEYVVTVDKTLTDEAIENIVSGVIIMGKKTKPSVVCRLDDFTFNIVLTQGLNRQIRRMCYKLGYQVTSLKRIRIVSIKLDQLKPGEFRFLEKTELLF